MKYKHSLRTRITLTFFLFGTILMVVVAVGVHNAIEGIEERVIKENLEMADSDLHGSASCNYPALFPGFLL